MNLREEIETIFTLQMTLGKALSQQVGFSFEEQTATMLQGMVLLHIKEHPHCTMTELSNATKLSVSSTTQIVERLVKAEFIERESDKSDRRIVRLTLTKKGGQEHDRIQGEMLAEMERIFSKISSQDRKDLIRIQKSLIKALNDDTIKKHEK